MQYQEFKHIFDELIFHNDRSHLVNNIATNKDRFVGLFRSTTPAAKLAQNVSQSREIRFGDAFEKVIQKLLEEKGWVPLSRDITGADGATLNVDQLLLDETGAVVMVEQKVRDDHDSTKRHGQVQNFEKKLTALKRTHGDKLKSAFFYFIDPSLKKNRRFYAPILERLMSEYGVSVHLSYGQQFFEEISYPELWLEITEHLELWRSELPQIPTLSFDEDSDRTVSEISQNVSASNFLKLFSDEDIKREIIPILFPTGEALRKLKKFYQHSNQPKSRELVYAIDSYLGETTSDF